VLFALHDVRICKVGQTSWLGKKRGVKCGRCDAFQIFKVT